jgi:uncharacterized protein (UPF0335 family)
VTRTESEAVIKQIDDLWPKASVTDAQRKATLEAVRRLDVTQEQAIAAVKEAWRTSTSRGWKEPNIPRIIDMVKAAHEQGKRIAGTRKADTTTIWVGNEISLSEFLDRPDEHHDALAGNPVFERLMAARRRGETPSIIEESDWWDD